MAIELTRTDTGTRRTVRLGEEFSVRLPEIPTTGYRWRTATDHERLSLVEDAFHGPTDPRGAGGEHLFTFRTTQCGLATVRIEKQRSWGSAEPIDEFSIELDIQPTR